jgi:polyribonucleotide nucleotidyltransferase
MDFKVAGTANGVTGLQMDIKVKGITYEIMEKALSQAHEAREFIMGKMLEVLPSPRADLSAYAPRILTIKINPEKIGALIGPGGKTIRSITDKTGVKIDIEDDGRVMISSSDGAAKDAAVALIQAITEDVEVGRVYHGKVVRLMQFGAFVEILPGKDGLVHVSDWANQRIDRIEDVAKIGDEVDVKVKEVDSQGRVNLTRRALLPDFDPSTETSRPERREGGGFRGGPPREGGFRDRGPREGAFRDRGPRDGGFRGGPPREGGFRDRAPREGGFGGGDRGPREGGFGGGDRGPREGGFGGDRAPREGGFGGGDRAPREGAGFGDRAPREGGFRGRFHDRDSGGNGAGGNGFREQEGGERHEAPVGEHREGGERPPERHDDE